MALLTALIVISLAYLVGINVSWWIQFLIVGALWMGIDGMRKDPLEKVMIWWPLFWMCILGFFFADLAWFCVHANEVSIPFHIKLTP